MSDYEVAWDLFKEARKQILEFQKIRAQLLGFKITFAGAAVGLVVANVDKVSPVVLLVPAFAAIFFDFLITSYSYSIKRSGKYCEKLEPTIKNNCSSPLEFPLWEEYFMENTWIEQRFSLFSNLGITLLAIVIAIVWPFISRPI